MKSKFSWSPKSSSISIMLMLLAPSSYLNLFVPSEPVIDLQLTHFVSMFAIVFFFHVDYLYLNWLFTQSMCPEGEGCATVTSELSTALITVWGLISVQWIAALHIRPFLRSQRSELFFVFSELHFTFLEGKTEALFISESPWPAELSKLLLVVLWIAFFFLCQQSYCVHLISFNWQICCKIFCFLGLLFCIGLFFLN